MSRRVYPKGFRYAAVIESEGLTGREMERKYTITSGQVSTWRAAFAKDPKARQLGEEYIRNFHEDPGLTAPAPNEDIASESDGPQDSPKREKPAASTVKKTFVRMDRFVIAKFATLHGSEKAGVLFDVTRGQIRAYKKELDEWLLEREEKARNKKRNREESEETPATEPTTEPILVNFEDPFQLPDVVAQPPRLDTYPLRYDDEDDLLLFPQSL